MLWIGSGMWPHRATFSISPHIYTEKIERKWEKSRKNDWHIPTDGQAIIIDGRVIDAVKHHSKMPHNRCWIIQNAVNRTHKFLDNFTSGVYSNSADMTTMHLLLLLCHAIFPFALCGRPTFAYHTPVALHTIKYSFTLCSLLIAHCYDNHELSHTDHTGERET